MRQVDEAKRPTRVNILQALQWLVRTGSSRHSQGQNEGTCKTIEQRPAGYNQGLSQHADPKENHVQLR